MPKLSETEKLGLEIIRLVNADERLASGDPEAVAIATTALAFGVAGVMVSVIISAGDDAGRAVGERFARIVNDEVNRILDRTNDLIAEVRFTRH